MEIEKLEITKMTLHELQQRQSWTLNQKIDHAIGTIEAFIARTGEVPILGVMAGESDLRKRQYIRRGGCNSFQNSLIASYPISIWTDADIWAYLRKFKVPYCELYDKGHTRTGCMFCGFGAHLEKVSRFDLLYDLHPKAYKMFMNYTNNGVTYREALHTIGVKLPDEQPKLF